MAIQRIERAVYGVDDVETCSRFFSDFGLAELPTERGARFATLLNTTVDLLPMDDPALPPGLEPGPTIREVVWGVDTQESLDALADDLGSDREVRVDPDGSLHTVDETGFGIGFTIAQPVDIELAAVRGNSHRAIGRWNSPLEPPGPVQPLRICHVALNIPKEGRERAVDFYLDRLHFRATDRVLQMGVFMQCEGDDDQHNILLCHRPDRAGINHTSYEVPGFDDVITGGNHMIECGWREARRLGRHTIGSNVFRFLHAPCGGRVEYAADMDRVDDTYETRVHETTPPHHLWTLRSMRDGEDA